MSDHRVLFLSYSFNRSDHRGVFQFTNSLLNGVSKNNYEIGLLTQIYSDCFLGNGLSGIISYLKDPKGFFVKDRHKAKIVLSYILGKIYKNNSIFFKNNETLGGYNSLNDFNFFVNHELLYYANNIDLLFSKSIYLKDICLPELTGQDVIFTDSPLAFKSSKHKMIQTVHDTIPLDEKRKYYQYFYKRLEACCYADKILAVSNHSKNKFLEYFPHMHDRIEVVYQPLPADEESLYLSTLPEIQAQVLEKYNLKSKQYMYYVGAIEERKNIHNLVLAYGKATSHDKSIPLVISGSINDSYCKKFNLKNFLVSKDQYIHSTNNVMKTDFVSDVEKLCLIRNSRAFLFPSLNEGFGIPVIEAQSLNIPVLTSNNSSLPEVVEDSALMLENPLDIDEMAEYIAILWSDNELCEELANKGLINVKRFSKENFKNGIGNFLADI